MRDAETFDGSTVRRFDGSGIRRHGGSGTVEPPHGRTAARFSPETRAAIAAAQAAGDLLLARVGRVRGVRLKSAKDPVTEADAAAERCIRRFLHRRFPRIGFLGEEGGAAEGPDGRWIVDPLDGTIGFVAGLPFFSVLIALERRGTLESSVTYVPRLGESFVAERGRGAWLNGRRIARVAPTPLGGDHRRLVARRLRLGQPIPARADRRAGPAGPKRPDLRRGIRAGQRRRRPAGRLLGAERQAVGHRRRRPARPGGGRPRDGRIADGRST